MSGNLSSPFENMFLGPVAVLWFSKEFGLLLANSTCSTLFEDEV
jgi:hypothetical protein